MTCDNYYYWVGVLCVGASLSDNSVHFKCYEHLFYLVFVIIISITVSITIIIIVIVQWYYCHLNYLCKYFNNFTYFVISILQNVITVPNKTNLKKILTSSKNRNCKSLFFLHNFHGLRNKHKKFTVLLYHENLFGRFWIFHRRWKSDGNRLFNFTVLTFFTNQNSLFVK